MQNISKDASPHLRSGCQIGHFRAGASIGTAIRTSQAMARKCRNLRTSMLVLSIG